MYRYDEFDRDFVKARADQFRDQVERRLKGELTEEEFRPLRLMNGLYLQLHAYMLRVAIPYGTLSSRQLRQLAMIARTYDKGYGHWTTRQNIQFNWPKLKDVPAILDALADVEMHAIQTSGNCIRNVTSDQFAGATIEEVADPRYHSEIIRQWSSLHPEFSFLPRKFKIAVTAAEHDRAAIQVHDIGLQLKKNEAGTLGFAVYVGGGLGRTPMIAKLIRAFVEEEHILSYLEAILRVYNLHGRRDNKYKARIKILVHEIGAEEFTRQVEEEWAHIKDGYLTLPKQEIDRIAAYFAAPAFEDLPAESPVLERGLAADPAFAHWAERSLFAHRAKGYTIVQISVKSIGNVPGDITDAQMERVADLAEKYSFDEVRITHEQNMVLPHVKKDDVPAVYAALKEVDLETGNSGYITDMITCPGLDYCSLANARSIPVAQRIAHRFEAPERQKEIGDLKIKISGCINACGHHHVGHIGILGVEKKGEEFYQILLGGSADEHTSIGEILGRGFSYEEIVDAVETVVDTYIAKRESENEPFLQTYRRLGADPFKEALYGTG